MKSALSIGAGRLGRHIAMHRYQQVQRGTQHRHQQDRQYAENAQLPLRLVRWDKKAGQAPGV